MLQSIDDNWPEHGRRTHAISNVFFCVCEAAGPLRLRLRRWHSTKQVRICARQGEHLKGVVPSLCDRLGPLRVCYYECPEATATSHTPCCLYPKPQLSLSGGGAGGARELTLPEGSPTRPVAPPSRATGVWPHRWNHASTRMPRRLPWPGHTQPNQQSAGEVRHARNAIGRTRNWRTGISGLAGRVLVGSPEARGRGLASARSARRRGFSSGSRHIPSRRQ